MRPGDRLICAFVYNLELSDEFKDWPLHVTVVPWFRTPVNHDELAEGLRQELESFKSFHVVMGDETNFGHGKTVNLVGRPTPFTEIEDQVRQTLKSHDAWIVDETTKQRHDYQPHVTAQREERLYRGDSFICDRLYVVKQNGGHKTISAIAPMGE